MRKRYYVIFGIIVILVISVVFVVYFYPNYDKGKTPSLNYYQNPENFLSEFKEICKKYGGEEPTNGFKVYDLECRDGEICKDMEPIEEFRNFCDKIDGRSRCYSSIWFVCVQPPNPNDEFTFCRWNLWQGSGCEEIVKYENKQCETDDDCGVGVFPCFEGKCLIKRCEEDCMNYYCASGTAHPHGYCVTEPGDI